MNTRQQIAAAGWTMERNGKELPGVPERYRKQLEGKPTLTLTKDGSPPIVVGGQEGIDPDVLIARAWEAVCLADGLPDDGSTGRAERAAAMRRELAALGLL